MRSCIQALIFIFTAGFLSAQTSIDLGTGTTLDIGTGTDVCTDEFTGSGALTGSGTICDAPLPVELTSFTAELKNKSVTLKWETVTEVDNYGFDVERKTGTGDWEKIGFVEGHGNSNSPKFYSFKDNHLNGGYKLYYRLKQIDTDGSFEYSEVINVYVVPESYELAQNYPNPFNPVTNIKFSVPEQSRVKITVYNMLGEKVIELVNAEYEPGFYEIQFNSSASGFILSSGMYIYTLESESFRTIKKMMLLR